MEKIERLQLQDKQVITTLWEENKPVCRQLDVLDKHRDFIFLLIPVSGAGSPMDQ